MASPQYLALGGGRLPAGGDRELVPPVGNRLEAGRLAVRAGKSLYALTWRGRPADRSSKIPGRPKELNGCGPRRRFSKSRPENSLRGRRFAASSDESAR